jgi:eukaryotic-like serine/threonine-protein kinase
MVAGPEQIGKYRVDQMLGSGSFATVWRGYDATLDATVAIKVLADNWSHDLDVCSRFVEEARILWRADHPRLVRVHAIDELPSGQPYFVMGYADCGSLLDRLQTAATLSVGDIMSIATQIAEGLDVLHQLGFVHRDLKPSNVLFRSVPDHHRNDSGADADGEADHVEGLMLADLGLAKALAHASGYTITTGTPAYMAPEQAEPMTAIDGRADVYSLGAMVYEMVAGVSPFPLGDVQSVRNRVSLRPPALSLYRPDISEEIDAAVQRALSFDREARQRSPREFAAALRSKPAPAVQRMNTPDRLPPPFAQHRAQGDQVPLDPGVATHRRARSGRRLVMPTVLAAIVAAGVSWFVLRPTDHSAPSRDYVTISDRSGKITAEVPAAWKSVARSGATGDSTPALLAAPDAALFLRDLNTPGVFLTLRPASGSEVPEHPGCTPSSATQSTLGKRTWTVVRYTCSPTASFVEAVTPASEVGGSQLLLAQVKEIVSSTTAANVASETNRLLGSINLN